jgi:hypothetical protein
MLLAGRNLKGIQGDPNQLGGDFIAEANGALSFVHPSRTATDRPTADELIAVLRKLHEETLPR